MFIYLLKYLVRSPFSHEYNLNIHDLDWDYVESKLRDVYKRGGEFVIVKSLPVYNDGKYVEFKEVIGYETFDRYSFIADKRYGYLLKCYLEEDQGDIKAGNFRLVNKNFEFSPKMIIFEPHDDEWPEKYVNQNFDSALVIFKELYENSMLSSDTLYNKLSRVV